MIKDKFIKGFGLFLVIVILFTVRLGYKFVSFQQISSQNPGFNRDIDNQLNEVEKYIKNGQRQKAISLMQDINSSISMNISLNHYSLNKDLNNKYIIGYAKAYIMPGVGEESNHYIYVYDQENKKLITGFIGDVILDRLNSLLKEEPENAEINNLIEKVREKSFK